MKYCISCTFKKPKAEFYKDKSAKDGLCSSCKSCQKKYQQKRYSEKKEHINNIRKKYYYDNIERERKKGRDKYIPVEDSEKECARCGKKVIVSAQANRWKYCDSCGKQKTLEKRRIWEYKKRQNNPTFRLNKNIGFMLWAGLKNKRKNSKSIKERLGYSIDELKEHLESQFKQGMNWDNYGEWHVDHIQPRTAFNFETCDCHGFKKCWALSNLQPLWGLENIEKGND